MLLQRISLGKVRNSKDSVPLLFSKGQLKKSIYNKVTWGLSLVPVHLGMDHQHGAELSH